MLVCPALGQIEHVQVACIAHAPIQLHLALHAARKGIFQNALDRCKPGCTGHHQQWTRTRMQGEAAKRSLKIDQITHRSEERRVGKKWFSTCRYRWSP